MSTPKPITRVEAKQLGARPMSTSFNPTTERAMLDNVLATLKSAAIPTILVQVARGVEVWRLPARPTASPDLLNCKQLAERLGRSAAYVSAMRAAGYAFQYGKAGTTYRHALSWLAAHPDFSSTAYATEHRSRPTARPASSAGKSDARSPRSGPRIPAQSAHPRPPVAGGSRQ